jgi:8-oxo-dGTP pyrophosphatase MutT (NUDIX family)
MLKMAIQSTLLSDYTATITKGLPFETQSANFNSHQFDLKPSVNSGMNSNSGRVIDSLEQIKQNVIRLLCRPWSKREVKWDEDEWNILEFYSKRYDTQSLMISCGTVTIDNADKKDRQVLLIWNKNTKAWQLPKGRKNVHEDLSTAAIRETTEETGVVVQPLYLRFGTRFTLPTDTGGQEDRDFAERLRKHPSSGAGADSKQDNGIVDLLNKDVFFISQYPDPATGAMRHIYWYAAKPQQGIVPDATLMGKEDVPMMTAKWFPAAEAVRRLKMTVEKEAVALAVHYAEQMSEEEWKYSLEL